MTNLERVLNKNWPIESVVVKCGECGMEILHSKKQLPTDFNPKGIAVWVKTFSESHLDTTGHTDINVAVNKKTPVQEMDVTVTVNE